MRNIWLIFGALLVAVLGLGYWQSRPAGAPAPRQPAEVAAIVLASQRVAGPRPAAAGGPRDSIVRLALRQLGTPYVWAGTNPRTGFDCSGFIAYVFGRFGVATPHATALLIDAGRPVPRAQAQPGDIVVFTGTAEGSTTPGHAGIVISALGETPLRFVHASSARRESGVKISQVENSGYERRFMQVRRVLDGAAEASPALAATSRPAAPRSLVHPAGPVTPLATAAPKVAADLATAPPTRVAPLPMRLRSAAKPGSPASKTATRRSPTKPTSPKKATKRVIPTKPKSKKLALHSKKTTRPAASPTPAPHGAKPKSR